MKFDYDAQEPAELSLRVEEVCCCCALVLLGSVGLRLERVACDVTAALQVISVLEVDDSGWWKGAKANGSEGWFPSNYIERL